MDQSPAESVKRMDEKQEQHRVTFASDEPKDHYSTDNHPRSPFKPAKDYEEPEEEEEDIDEEEEEAFERRLLEAQQRNQQQHSPRNGISGQDSTTQSQSFTTGTGSPPDSMDSGDFVKLEKPHDLFTSPISTVKIRLDNTDGISKEEEITPSDDVAQPVGDDLRDFASSPQDAAHELADREAAHHQTLEEFIASTAGETTASAMHRPIGEEISTTSKTRHVAFNDEDDEETFRRHGPLTLGQPATETSLHLNTGGDLIDGSHSPSFTEQAKSAFSDAASAVGEFASKMTSDAKEGAFKAKEIMESGASQVKETAEDLLDFYEEEKREFAPLDNSPPPRDRDYSLDQPETPIIVSPARPPTPPKPRAADAPETPPILDLGGPGHHPTQQYPPHYRKPSLKMSTTPIGGFMTTESIRIGNAAKAPAWMDFRHWDKNVLDLIYWRDVKKSGIVFGVTLALLICLATFNIITVVSYLCLLNLAAALSFRAYTAVMATVNKTEQKNPFQPLLEKNLDLPQDHVHEQVDVVLKHGKDLLHQLRRLFLVEDFCETLKFALLLWALTYVGAYFSGTALIILAFVGLFTLPKVYELYQPQIDHYYGIVESKVKHASEVAREQLDKVPFFKKQKPQEKQE